MVNLKKVLKTCKKHKNSIWAFPALLLVTFLLLVAFKINGSSIGIYYSATHGSKAKDSSLIYGSPKPIRSDEWKSWTMYIAMQSKSGEPVYNNLMGSGRDLAKQAFVPIKDWSQAFKPFSLGFFVLSFEYAFSIQWWLPLFLLIFSSYLFVLKLTKSKKLAIILSLSFSISPFMFWWYQVEIFFSLACLLLAMILSMRFIENKPLLFKRNKYLSELSYVAIISYLGIAFCLLIYFPFLYPILLVAIAFIIGYFLEKKSKKIEIAKYLRVVSSILAVVAIALSIFFVQHREMISAVQNTEYPGQRSVPAGTQKPLAVLDGFLMPKLQQSDNTTRYYDNLSEASNFILLLPFLLLPTYFILFRQWKKRALNKPLLSIQIISTLFLARLYVPWGDFFYKISLLDKIPHNRLLFGLGFAGFIQIILLLSLKNSISKKLLISYCLLCLGVLVYVSEFVIKNYPSFLSSSKKGFLYAVVFTLLIYLILSGRKYLFALLFLAFSIYSSYNILPIYKGADFLERSKIVQSIQEVSRQDQHWVVLDNEIFENLPLAAGRGLINGAQIYPDVSFWRQIDPTGEYEHIYNRQAHALFLTNTLEKDPDNRYNVRTIDKKIELVKANVFKVKFECDSFTYNNVDFALTVSQPVKLECLELVREVAYPKKTFYIYKVIKPISN